MNLLEFKAAFEKEAFKEFKIELLELIYRPYSFGSGIIVYRLHGYNFRFLYDGRDNELACERSNHHEKYPLCKWIGVGVKNLSDGIVKEVLLWLKMD